MLYGYNASIGTGIQCKARRLYSKSSDCHNAGEADGVRLYSHELPFFQMASTGSGVVITANEVLHPFLKEFTGDTERFKHPYWLFELPHLLCIERELNKYDYTLSSTFHMFLARQATQSVCNAGRFYT